MKYTSVSLFLLLLGFVIVNGQGVDYSNIKLDRVEYVHKCFMDTLLFENLSEYDTVKCCTFYRKLIYKEIIHDTIFDIQFEELKSGKIINEKQYGLWRDYRVNKVDELYNWERLISWEVNYYFDTIRIGNVPNGFVSFDFSRLDTLYANFTRQLSSTPKITVNLALSCFPQNSKNKYTCFLSLLDNDFDANVGLIREVPINLIEQELILISTGYYDRKLREMLLERVVTYPQN